MPMRTFFTRISSGFATVMMILFFATLATAPAATLTVSNNLNSGIGSLRQAISNSISGDTITFATNLSGSTITLTSGQLLLNKNLSLDASALPARVLINGNQASRIFEVSSNVTVELISLTITNGRVTGGLPSGYGGGVINQGVLTLTNCAVLGNSAATAGGGIYNRGSGILVINNSTLSGNTAPIGGAMQDEGLASATGSTFSGNFAANRGAGVSVAFGTLNATNCTFSANVATNYGGAIYNGTGALTLNHCTVSANFAGVAAGGIYKNASLTIQNSIVAGNTAPENPNLVLLAEPFTVTGNNLTNGNPLLAPLARNGGLTQTMLPMSGSPIIDAATNSTASVGWRRQWIRRG